VISPFFYIIFLAYRFIKLAFIQKLKFDYLCLSDKTSSISSRRRFFVLSNIRKWYIKSAASFLNNSRLSSFDSITNSTASSPTFCATLLIPLLNSCAVYDPSVLSVILCSITFSSSYKKPLEVVLSPSKHEVLPV